MNPQQVDRPKGIEDLSAKQLEALSSLRLYIVMNDEGKYFRAKGYGGYGDTWTADPKKARYYAKIGPARATVTFFMNNYKNYPPPLLIEIKAGVTTILDESSRLAKIKEDAKTRKERNEVRAREAELRAAESNLRKAQERLERAQKE